MRSEIRNLLVLAVVAMLVVACDAKEGSSTAGSPAAPPRSQPVYGSGTIRGLVKFAGTPPVMGEIPNQPCHEAAKPLKEEAVVVNSNGTLANVFVYLKDAPPSDGSSREPVLLDQVNCQFVPHAVGVQVGQALRIRSSDPTLHNVHYTARHNTPANFGLTVKGAEKSVKYDAHEILRVKCDVHPWMTGYIGIFDSPFYSVSNTKDGSFEIPRVPAGTYTCVAWHERYGQIEQPVEVKDSQVVDVTMEYKAP